MARPCAEFYIYFKIMILLRTVTTKLKTSHKQLYKSHLSIKSVFNNSGILKEVPFLLTLFYIIFKLQKKEVFKNLLTKQDERLHLLSF